MFRCRLFLDSCDLDWLSQAVLGDDQAFPLQLDVAEYLSSEVAELVSSPDSNGQLSPGSLSGDWSPSSVSPDWSPSSVSRKAAQQNSPLHFQILPAISRPAALQPLVVDHALCIRPEHDLQESAKSRKKAGTRKERKRVQNRDAATRYRVKKRTAETVLDDRVHCLETENKQLQEKAAQLRHEVTTLKSLWQEMEKLKGGLRNQADDLQF